MISRSRFEELVIPHQNSAFNLAYWILRSRKDAEDAVQDAYVRAFRALDKFAGTGVRAWLLAIVRNVAYSALEARKRSRNVITLSEELRLAGDGIDAVSQEPSPEAQVIVQEGQQLLLDALSKLPPIHRDILVLREIEGISYAEISQITGIAIGTVMSRLSRARAELLRSVGAQFREPLDNSMSVLEGRQNSTRGLDDAATAWQVASSSGGRSIFGNITSSRVRQPGLSASARASRSSPNLLTRRDIDCPPGPIAFAISVQSH
jgi:RNA polymerase sigma-70 factor, ECF subfamily